MSITLEIEPVSVTPLEFGKNVIVGHVTESLSMENSFVLFLVRCHTFAWTDIRRVDSQP